MYQMSQSYVSASISRLESMASSYSPSPHQDPGIIRYAAASFPSFQDYMPKTLFTSLPLNSPYVSESQPRPYQHATANYHFFQPHQEYQFIPDNFLQGDLGGFVGKAEEVHGFVEEAFQNLFAVPFPSTIKICVLSEVEFRKVALSPETIGLSINRQKDGLLSEIFVLNDSLARVLLTIGHELGHVLTETLDHVHDEEAKAYAFSLVWMKTIKEHNIANLQNTIILENPAENGLHNVAFAFVTKLLKEGKDIWEIYNGLIKRLFSLS